MKCNETGEIIQIEKCGLYCKSFQDIHFNYEKEYYEISIYEDSQCTKLVDLQTFSCPKTQIGQDAIDCSNPTKNIKYTSLNVSGNECSASVNIDTCTPVCGDGYFKFLPQNNILNGYSISLYEDMECNQISGNINFICLPDQESITITPTTSMFCISSSLSSSSSSSESDSSTLIDSSSSLIPPSSSTDGSTNSSTMLKHSFILLSLVLINMLL